LPPAGIGEGRRDDIRYGEDPVMSESTSSTHPAGEDVSDEEMVQTVADQTDSASENADTAGKDWNGEPGEAPAPDDRA
jgi:hypothetical protein